MAESPACYRKINLLMQIGTRTPPTLPTSINVPGFNFRLHPDFLLVLVGMENFVFLSLENPPPSLGKLTL